MSRENKKDCMNCLHYDMMYANWHQYIECTSMRVGILNNNLSLKRTKKKHLPNSAQLMNK